MNTFCKRRSTRRRADRCVGIGGGLTPRWSCLDLPGNGSMSDVRPCGLALEGQGPFSVGRRMPAAGVVEAVDALEERRLRFAAGRPRPSPEEFGLQGLEEGLDGVVLVAVSLAAHRNR